VLRYFEKIKPYKNLLKNFTSLSVLQFSNYLFPLIVLPYVVRILGPDKYGLVQFAAAFNIYFQMLCDYNFALTGTRMISQNRKDLKKVSEIFSSIIIIKIILFLFSFLLLLAIIFSVEKFSRDWPVYLISFGMVLGSVLSPLWFFQGIEQMKYITIIQVAIRIISTIFIFTFIRASSDYLILVAINSSTFIAIGLTGLLVSLIKFNIKIVIPKRITIINILKQGWNIFLSSIWINLYTTSNTFVLGLFTNNTIVGYYAAADKIRIAFQGIHSTLSLSVFPFVSNLVKESYADFINFNRKLLKFSGIGGLIISSILFLSAKPLADIILGKDFFFSADLLQIISLLPLLISLSNVFGIQTMLPMGFDKSFNKIIGFAALVHIILLLIFIPAYFAKGVAYSVVLTELLVTISMFIFLKIKKINLLAK
jgi:O-antigen/teichoic acid export membrane protein